jgi:hypothetical protein
MVSKSRPKQFHAVFRVPAVAAALAPLLVPLAAQAAAGDIDLPIYELPAGSHAAAERAPERSGPVRSGAAATRATTVDVTRPTSSFALVEMPPEASMPGSGYKRPHHALGYRWQAAESWLRDHGFDAQTCFLPMMRMHTKLSPSGVSGTLWIYGRCTFR